MSTLPRKQAGVLFALVFLLAGCHPKEGPTSVASPDVRVVNLDAEITQATKSRRPLVVLVIESGLSPADDDARALFTTLAKENRQTSFASLDIGNSRNRAEATRFHIENTPLLVCLTSRGVMVSRDEGPMTQQLMLDRVNAATQRAPELDAKFASLEEAIAKNESDATAQLALADFLLAQKNAREAIPHLAVVARSESADTANRVRAWVDLARAHLWIAEPEKGRHEAHDLIDILGPTTSEARAGGNLVLGLQDAHAKRAALARQEFAAAVAAAPESMYGKQAAEEMAKIPGAGK